MEDNTYIKYILCDCHYHEHYIHFWIEDYPTVNKFLDDDLVCTFTINAGKEQLPFLNRLKKAWEFFTGKSVTYNEVILKETQVKEIIEVCKEYLRRQKENKRIKNGRTTRPKSSKS